MVNIEMNDRKRKAVEMICETLKIDDKKLDAFIETGKLPAKKVVKTDAEKAAAKAKAVEKAKIKADAEKAAAKAKAEAAKKVTEPTK